MYMIVDKRIKTDEGGEVAESRKYVYNENNQLVLVEMFIGKKTVSASYTSDEDGNLIRETGKDWHRQGGDDLHLYGGEPAGVGL